MVVSRRTAEVLVALGAACVGLVVVIGALQHDVGWGPTGPGAGYFPLRVGALLAAAGLLLAARNALGDRLGRFAAPGAGRRILRLFLPTAIFGIGIAPLGTYLPMAGYLLWMGRREAHLPWARTIGFALITPLVFYLLFEVWLMVPLAKGPVEEALGIW